MDKFDKSSSAIAPYTIEDKKLGEYLAKIAEISREISLNKKVRNDNIRKRYILLFVARQTMFFSAEKKLEKEYREKRTLLIKVQREEARLLEEELMEPVKTLKKSKEDAEDEGDDERAEKFKDRIEVTEVDNVEKKKALGDKHFKAREEIKYEYEEKLQAIKKLKSKDQKIDRVFCLTDRAAALSCVINRQNEAILDNFAQLSEVSSKLGSYVEEGKSVAANTASPKRFKQRIIPDFWKSKIRFRFSDDEVAKILTAVGEGDIDTVRECLGKNINLVHARGVLKDVANRSFEEITGFQYALWSGDIPMCELFLRYMTKSDFANQMDILLNHRLDIKKEHGVYFIFDRTNEAYDVLIKNFDEFDDVQCKKQLEETIGLEQCTWPAWMRYKFIEHGINTAWTKQRVTIDYKRNRLLQEIADWYGVTDTWRGEKRLGVNYAWSRGTGKYPRLDYISENSKQKNSWRHEAWVDSGASFGGGVYSEKHDAVQLKNESEAIKLYREKLKSEMLLLLNEDKAANVSIASSL